MYQDETEKERVRVRRGWRLAGLLIVVAVYLAALLLPGSGAPAGATGARELHDARGYLVILGDGERPDYLLHRIDQLASGERSVSVVLPTTGEELDAPTAHPLQQLRDAGAVLATESLGLLPSTLVDQHAVSRDGHNQLLSLVLEHPELLGLDIGDSTAVIAGPEKQLEVLGEGTVVVYDASSARDITTDPHGQLAAHDVQLHVLKSGDSFSLPGTDPP